MTDHGVASPAPQLRCLTATFYRFVALPDAAEWRARLLRECSARQLTGTIVLASEGVNATIAGAPGAVQALLDWLQQADPRFARLRCLTARCAQLPLRRLRVQLKPEVVKLGIGEIDPRGARAGVVVAPQHWNRLLARDDLVLIDVRNDYEVALGSFVGAIDPQTARFSDLPGWIERERAAGGALAAQPAVAMFCTGGIRCEKASALLRAQGFDEVFQLGGGILGYLAAVAAAQSRWRGECFVFDERVSVGHGLREGRSSLCSGCGQPMSGQEHGLLTPAAQRLCMRCCTVATARNSVVLAA